MLAAGVAVGAMLVGGLTVASNMGFKFVPNVGAGTAFDLSLPWNNNYTKANELYNDIKSQDPDIDRVSKFNSNASLTNWSQGSSPSANFAVNKGEAYIVFAKNTGPIDQAVIVGSHDPNFTLDFLAANGGWNNAAAPYHQTFTKANELFNDLTSQYGSAIDRVSKYNSNASLTNWQSGAPPSANFTLDLGMGVLIHATSDATGYVWPHY
ncbi:MAG: hypothetical protein D6718_11700 [Acidobacteria bacterium]|nr:MAG: hypothetical protein D6718_11700 [Acidobacteriota bacterium]